jgi:acylphosphatase
VNQKRIHIIVRGLVQGVGYRMFVLREASSRGLSGWIRNLPDDTVEIEAQGEPEMLETLLCKLRQGPSRSRVTRVNVRETDLDADAEGFLVR